MTWRAHKTKNMTQKLTTYPRIWKLKTNQQWSLPLWAFVTFNWYYITKAKVMLKNPRTIFSSQKWHQWKRPNWQKQGNLLKGIDNKTVRRFAHYVYTCSLLSKTDKEMKWLKIEIKTESKVTFIKQTTLISLLHTFLKTSFRSWSKDFTKTVVQGLLADFTYRLRFTWLVVNTP